MQAVANRVSSYWARRMQAAFIATMHGVFADNAAAPTASEHVLNDMTNDISGSAFTDGVTNFSGAAMIDAAVTMLWRNQRETFETHEHARVAILQFNADRTPEFPISCLVDDVVMQDSNTRELCFGPIDLIEYASTFVTLVPGDLLVTGTPGGVGMARDPQVFLRHGQTLTTRVDGVGECRNRLV